VTSANPSRGVMMDIGLGLARALSSAIGMFVLVLLTSGSHRAATRLGLQKPTREQAQQ
jgi:hypothetical protein